MPTTPHTRTPLSLVQEFHSLYNLPDRIKENKRPTLNIDRLPMRMDLIMEEFLELLAVTHGERAVAAIQAAWLHASEVIGIKSEFDYGTRTKFSDDDTIEAADALGDIVYVIFGLAIEAGIDLDVVLAEIQRSNLTKLGEDGKPIYREDGKVIKGPNFQRPQIGRVLGLE